MFFFFQAEDGIRDLVRSRGLGDVYKRQALPVGERNHRIGRPEIEPKRARRCMAGHGVLLWLSLIHI